MEIFLLKQFRLTEFFSTHVIFVKVLKEEETFLRFIK